MKVRYVGSYDVEVIGAGIIQANTEVELPDDLAQELLSRGNNFIRTVETRNSTRRAASEEVS